MIIRDQRHVSILLPVRPTPAPTNQWLCYVVKYSSKPCRIPDRSIVKKSRIFKTTKKLVPRSSCFLFLKKATTLSSWISHQLNIYNIFAWSWCFKIWRVRWCLSDNKEFGVMHETDGLQQRCSGRWTWKSKRWRWGRNADKDIKEKKKDDEVEMVLRKSESLVFSVSLRTARKSTSLDSSMWSTRLVGFPRKLDVLLQWTLNLFKRDHIRSSQGPRDLYADTVAEFLPRRHQLEWATSDLQRLRDGSDGAPWRVHWQTLVRGIVSTFATAVPPHGDMLSRTLHTVSFPSPCSWTRRPSLDVKLFGKLQDTTSYVLTRFVWSCTPCNWWPSGPQSSVHLWIDERMIVQLSRALVVLLHVFFHLLQTGWSQWQRMKSDENDNVWDYVVSCLRLELNRCS